MFKNLRSKVAAFFGALLVSGSAAAQSVDVTAVVSAIGAGAAPIAAIGAAVLLIFVGIKVYKWVRRAL